MTTKFDTEKFDGNTNFILWKIKMRAILISDGLEALLGKNNMPDSTSEDKKDELISKALSTI